MSSDGGSLLRIVGVLELLRDKHPRLWTLCRCASCDQHGNCSGFTPCVPEDHKKIDIFLGLQLSFVLTRSPQTLLLVSTSKRTSRFDPDMITLPAPGTREVHVPHVDVQLTQAPVEWKPKEKRFTLAVPARVERIVQGSCRPHIPPIPHDETLRIGSSMPIGLREHARME